MSAERTPAAAAVALAAGGPPLDGPGRWGMVLLVVNEGTLFVLLLFSYFYTAAQSAVWPPGELPRLALALPNTLALLASSVTLAWGERGMRRGDPRRLQLGLLLTLLLGSAFLAVQGLEYARSSFTPATHAYGSLFFTITGFHGAHVLVGLILNAVVLVRSWGFGHFSRERHLAVRNASLYWHFVDAVWLCVFASLYLSPRLL